MYKWEIYHLLTETEKKLEDIKNIILKQRKSHKWTWAYQLGDEIIDLIEPPISKFPNGDVHCGDCVCFGVLCKTVQPTFEDAKYCIDFIDARPAQEAIEHMESIKSQQLRRKTK